MAEIHRDYSEKRDYHRMLVDCPMVLREQDAEAEEQVVCRNLSGGGLMFVSEHPYAIGTLLKVRIEPNDTIVAPLEKVIEIVRVDYSDADHGYEVAGMMRA